MVATALTVSSGGSGGSFGPSIVIGGLIGGGFESGTDRLPVTDPLRPRKVLGFVGHADVIAGYNRELLRRRAAAPRDA